LSFTNYLFYNNHVSLRVRVETYLHAFLASTLDRVSGTSQAPLVSLLVKWSPFLRGYEDGDPQLRFRRSEEVRDF